MADIHTYPVLRHLRGSPTTYVEHTLNGRALHNGVGRSFWFRPLSAVLSEVPVDEQELPLLFHARTSDYQDVVVQTTLTYRIAEPERAVTRIDFGIDPGTGRWRGTPLEQLASMLTELVQQHALELLAATPLAAALVQAPRLLRTRIEAGLRDDERLGQVGIVVVGVRVGAVRPDPDLERALGMPARELVQREADRATFERRALAVESERAIAENELDNQIQLARQEEQLIAQRGLNEQRQAEDAAAAARIETGARAEGIRAIGEAEADAELRHVGAYADVPPPILLGLALRELAANLPEIERLTITPDLLTDALARVAGARQ